MKAFVSFGEDNGDLPIMQRIKERKKERFRFPVALHIYLRRIQDAIKLSHGGRNRILISYWQNQSPVAQRSGYHPTQIKICNALQIWKKYTR